MPIRAHTHTQSAYESKKLAFYKELFRVRKYNIYISLYITQPCVRACTLAHYAHARTDTFVLQKLYICIAFELQKLYICIHFV